MRKVAFAGVAAAGMLVPAIPAWGQGGPPQTFTQITHKDTQSDVDVNPCTGDPGIVTTTANSVFHLTQFPDGHGSVTGTTTGTFTFDTFDPSLPDFSGRFTSWFGGSDSA